MTLAVEELYRQHREDMTRFAHRRLARFGAAEDVVNDLFIDLFEAGEPIEPDTAYELLSTKVETERTRSRRRLIRETPVGGQADLAWAEDRHRHIAPTSIAAAEFTAEFNGALEGLEPEEREAYLLTELRGLTVREAAAVTHLPKSTLGRHAEAARTYIAKELS